MSQTKLFFAITGSLLFIAFTFLAFGWWALIPVLAGVIWQVAGLLSEPRRPKPSRPHPTHVASVASKPASTVTWQETVEAIERARAVPCDEQLSPPQPLERVLDQRPWQERVDEMEQRRLPVRDGFHEHLQMLMNAGEWDAARSALQKLAYRMPDASPEEKLAFAGYAKDFAALDPLFKRVLEVVLPAVSQSPGLKQTEAYALLPDLDKETVRYVLYYAHVLALIERKKKGSTYQLFPFVEGVSERWDVELSRQLAKVEAAKPTDKQIRAQMWNERLPQLLAATDRRPYWQFRSVGDSMDPPSCKALSGRVERFDSEFWRTKAPWMCQRLQCRCTVRACTRDELEAKGIAVPE